MEPQMNTDKHKIVWAFFYLCSSVFICGSISLPARGEQPFQLSLRNDPLPQALKKIGNETGVRIDPTESVYNLLRWGEQTTINATIANQSLRDALTAIARKLGLMFVLKDDYVELRPVPA